jgi:hypothetical protein
LFLFTDVTEQKSIPEVSYRALKATGEKKYVQGVCYFINKIPKFIFKKEKGVYVKK